jgi:CubicO group peptidase (beta-lactamase class C family)
MEASNRYEGSTRMNVAMVTRRLLSVFLGASLFALPCWGPELAAQGAPSAGPLSEQVDSLFQRWHRPDSPGAAVLVMHGGAVVHRAGYGMASLEHGVPNRTTTVFDIASVSKQFGAYAVALLDHEGRLSLDDDVRKWIPELHDFGRTITLRHLVHHTGGIRDWPGTLSMAGWSYEDVLSFEQILRMAYDQRDLNFDPGAEYAYSNTGYNLLAEVVARATGMSFREWTQERIFAPLGMTQTHFHDDHREVIRDRAESYAPGPDGRWWRVTNNLTALASSSLFTTTEDLALWVRHFHDPDPRLGGARVVERMHERGLLNGGDTIAYAFGQNWTEWRGLRTASHGGSWAGFRTVLQRFPDQDFAVIILANTADMNPSALAREVAAIWLGDELAPQEEDAAGTVAGQGEGEAGDRWAPDVAELRGYEGVYRAAEFPSEYRIQVADDGLVARHFRTGDRPLRPTAPDRFQSPGFGEVVFQRGPGGEVTGFTANSARIRGLRFERIPE